MQKFRLRRDQLSMRGADQLIPAKGLPFQHVFFVHAQKRFPLSAKALL